MYLHIHANALTDRALALWRRATHDPLQASVVACALVLLIALVDYGTGYEIRLAILYLLPITLATWASGWRVGALTSTLAALCWGISFQQNHIYSRALFYYWEGVLLIATFIIFMLLVHQLRRALDRSDARFLHVLNGLSAGIYVIGTKDNKLLYANPHFGRMTQGDISDTAVATFESRLIAAAPLTAAERPAPASPFRYEEARDEQTGLWYFIQSTQIPWVDSRQVTLKIVMDVTEQKQALVLKRQHQDMLHNTARFSVLAEIASMLGHEINQPLMAIATYINACILLLSKQDADIAGVIAALEKSRTQVGRASQIVERTRGFLKRRSASLTSSDMNDTILGAVRSLELELQGASISLHLQLAPQLPPLLFDRILIEQVLVNLLRNAIDVLAAEPVSHRRILLASTITGHHLHVTVADNGPGISVEVAEKLYTPFFTTKQHGLGLGLCICRSIIEAHAGLLWHEERPDGGTAFQFTLPLQT